MQITPGATCLERSALEESIDRALDGRVDSTGLEVEVLGSGHDPRSALIRLSRAGEPLAQRAFSPGPASCADFHAAIALAIALMIKNAERPPSSEPVPPTPAPSAATESEHASTEPLPERPSPPRTSTPHNVRLRIAPIDAPSAARTPHPREFCWRAQAAGALGLQIGAPISSGFTSDLVYAGARFELQLGVLALFSSTDALGSSSLLYRTRPIAASLTLAAALLKRPAATLRVSLGFLAGRIRTEIDDDGGGDAADSQRAPWVAGRAALELALPVARELQLAVSAGPLWSARKLGVKAYDAESEDLIASELFRPVGALLALGLAYERKPSGLRQGLAAQRHPSP